MRTLIIGGSGSGKSSYAESRCVDMAGAGPLVYLATMSAVDGESIRRIDRHRTQRAGKGFETVEKSRALTEVSLKPDTTVLLEDMGNLVANELYGPGGDRDSALRAIDEGILHLEQTAQNLVVVGNCVFSDGCKYDNFTLEYIELIAQLQNRMAGRFDQVVEVVCGIPIIWKGEGA